MPKREHEWPEPGELVIGTVSRVNPFSIFVTLEEYGKKEGMVHVSEIARKWVRDIREFVKEGQRIVALVLTVDVAKRHIGLSLKRVNEHEAGARLQQFKREVKAEKMLAAAASRLKLSLDECYRQIGFKLRTEFGEMFRGFQTAASNPQLLISRGFPANITEILSAVAAESIEAKLLRLKAVLELTCTRPDGVEIIKALLSDATTKYGIEIKYISAPKYAMLLTTRDAKAGQKLLKEACEAVLAGIRAAGGDGSFKLA